MLEIVSIILSAIILIAIADYLANN